VGAVLAATLAELVSPQVVRWVIDSGIEAADREVVLAGSAALVGVALLAGLFRFVRGYLTARVSQGVAFEMRNAVFSKLQGLSFSYHDSAETGQLITRVTSDVDLVKQFVGGGLVEAISAVLLLVGTVTFLLLMNWQLTLVALVSVPLTLAVLLGFVGRLGPRFRAFQRTLGNLNGVLQENVTGIRIVKSYTAEEFEAERYRTVNTELLEQGLDVRRAVANAFPLLFLVSSLGTALVIWAGAAQIVVGSLTVGELVAFTAYLALLLRPLFIIGFGAQTIARSGASAQRVFEVLDAESDVVERPEAITIGRLDGGVKLERVVLRYPGEDSPTLDDVSLSVRPGERVALVGATGSGKTSLVNLVPRFYDVDEGAVLIDGVDVRDVTLESLRSQIGVVMQEPLLFSGSIRENIAYGRPDATDAEVGYVAETAQIAGFVRGLPDGFDTLVGERGVRLSGGQRQRITIARALLVDPRILIMDDSMSAVDMETEAALRAALESLAETRTTFVIAHRLPTVRTADKIVVLDEGRIVAVGTHEELAASSCLYAELLSLELSDSAAGESLGRCD
jgi:ATP-binding cassette subfamily B protein